ncbi:hypothetical protein A3H22_01745 [Candidatus Peribacteria bacterium RIFCSPLOWO2_12_FULL_55_15]|nr:MAG: hypothetical protein A2789_03345 [Candidatus Peribacteria bacterium RIFCSPHIGHO2_01_FULL_54_22]OGJ63414.1 MAG: hypothetical protein A3D12_04175 [Candidatus Peribacteria bacterium RIFCSPHIGHO2_02_FULL_55_24]OGJ67983.1 MAG: hypothetical protein A2947_00760 [Candidatus Peribacteria bacterium RIFCSPLOWO2_01_FULL_54_110]OGJ70821.1 MAG: hypothetical protein A3H22_01745 [Candidatus Peribacteria bacterium RIFCSPLOWO2_12_FULL_55_15]
MQEHPLHLLLRCTSIASDGELQLEWSRFEDWTPLVRCDREDDTPCMSNVHRAVFIVSKEEFLDDDNVWLCLMKECIEILSNFFETFVEGHGFCSDREPIGCPDVRWVRHLYGTETDGGKAWVDTDDSHADRL